MLLLPLLGFVLLCHILVRADPAPRLAVFVDDRGRDRVDPPYRPIRAEDAVIDRMGIAAGLRRNHSCFVVRPILGMDHLCQKLVPRQRRRRRVAAHDPVDLFGPENRSGPQIALEAADLRDPLRQGQMLLAVPQLLGHVPKLPLLLRFQRLYGAFVGHVSQRAEEADGPALGIAENFVLAIDDPHRAVIRSNDPVLERRGRDPFPDLISRPGDDVAVFRMDERQKVRRRRHERVGGNAKDLERLLRPFGPVRA